MRHILFSLFAIATLLFTQSCANEPSCNLEGKWTVANCDIQSSKLSPTIISMAKDEYLSSTYEFMKENKFMIYKLAETKTTSEGTYTFDDSTQTLNWQTNTDSGNPSNESFEVTSCTGNSVTLSQRLPADPAKEEIATVNLTLNKEQ